MAVAVAAAAMVLVGMVELLELLLLKLVLWRPLVLTARALLFILGAERATAGASGMAAGDGATASLIGLLSRRGMKRNDVSSPSRALKESKHQFQSCTTRRNKGALRKARYQVSFSCRLPAACFKQDLEVVADMGFTNTAGGAEASW
jgi:hypothetical protein